MVRNIPFPGVLGIPLLPLLLLPLLTPRAYPEECLASSSWFPRTSEPDLTRDLDPENDCDFYGFSWQYFLYLTQDEKGGDGRPRFLSFETPASLVGVPKVMGFPDVGKLAPEKRKLLALTPRVVKPRAGRSFEGINQALTNGVLVDRNGHPVYYAVHVNQRFADFIRQNGLTTLEALKALDKNKEFPVGSVELKSAWRVVEAGDDAATFYTTRANVPVLKQTDAGVVIDEAAEPREVTVALVGLHVVAVPKGHPEFVWATFEHVENAPDLPAGMGAQSAAPVTDSDWTFCPKGTLANQCNVNPTDSAPSKLKLDPVTQRLTPVTPVFRQFAFGGDDPRGVVTLTGSVHEKLPKELAVWKNYELIGAVWLDKPSTSFKVGRTFADDELGGAKSLSSSTMETFTQTLAHNCFACHTTGPMAAGNEVIDPKKFNVSHAMTTALLQKSAAGK